MNPETPTLSRELRHAYKLSLPLMASQAVQASSGFIGTMIVAHLGKAALAASVLVSTTWITLIVLLFGILNAVSILVAQQCGAKQHNEVSKIVMQAFYVATCLAMPAMIAMRYEPNLLQLLGEPPSVVQYAEHYLHALLWCILPLSYLIVMEQFLIGIAKTRLVLWISIVQVPFEVLLCYALTFGKFGLPRLGIAGIGYGFSLVFLIACIFVALYLTKSHVGRRYPVLKQFGQWSQHYLKQIFKIGWPIGFMYGTEVAMFALMTFLMGGFGLNALAAHQIAFQFLGLAMSIVFGISQAASAHVGFAAGQGDREKIRLAMMACALIAFIVMLIAAFLYWFMPALLISLDKTPSLNQTTIHLAVRFLFIVAFFQLADGFRLVTLGALRGINDTRIPLWISLASFSGFGFVMAAFIAFFLHVGSAGLWWGVTIGDIACTLLLVYRFHTLIKKIDLTALIAKQ